ncbi:sugar-binding domain-containing protein [Winogradskyella sp. R77965]|uniref:sugar-binding domain-containing protein n=1 Tax=Winogradskyella sp. R77965 TaxID=3093872 RepID=UPI0037DC3C23
MILRFAIFKFVTLCSFILLLFSCENTTENKNQERSKTNINNDWLYLENNTENLSDALDQDDWQNINLPHTWNALDATDLEPGYRRSGSWYKKKLDIPSIVSGQIYQLYFEGVNITSEVYVNGKKVGNHIGGYIGFTIDITDAISSGTNEILVRADNGYNPEVIPSQKSDFFIFGGITRRCLVRNFTIEAFI